MVFKIEIDQKKRQADSFIISAHEELQKAYKASGLKSHQIAKKLGRDILDIEDVLNHKKPLTLRDLGELAWALDVVPELKFNSLAKKTSYSHVQATPENSRYSHHQHIHAGQECFTGTRILTSSVQLLIDAGWSDAQINYEYTSLTRKQIAHLRSQIRSQR